MASELDIAIIGMSGRFPGAPDLDHFRSLIREGRESITHYSEKELMDAGIDPALLAKPNYVRSEGVLEAADCFDAGLFGFSHAEARTLDPQIRVFMETVWACLDHAAYDPQRYPNRIGLFAGASDNLWWQALSYLSGGTEFSEQFAAFQLNNKDFLATQIAYQLNLRGPAIMVDTACSTSLVAVHQACQALLNGECEMAIAGGVTVSLPLVKGYLYQEGMIFSPDGHCRPFDRMARGTVGGNGSGAVLLKPLEEAEAEGDCIHAVIRGSAINNDGNRKAGYSAPSVEGQAEVIRLAHHLAEVEADAVGYVETHGTGTPLGDPVELAALKLAFNSNRRRFCALGAVKSNLGHLDAAAGIAGLIKTVLVLKEQHFPPVVHFQSPNPELELESSPFFISTGGASWPAGPRLAGVSSFGIGGTNAHVVLEAGPVSVWQSATGLDQQAVPFPDQQVAQTSAGAAGSRTSFPVGKAPAGLPELILLSAQTREALQDQRKALLKWLDANPAPSIPDLAYSLQSGRQELSHRLAISCRTVPDLKAALADDEQILYGKADRDKPSIVLLFPGQGAQYPDMGRDLYVGLPAFRQYLDECFGHLAKLVDWNPLEVLFADAGAANPGQAESRAGLLRQTACAQPLIFSIEYALGRLLLEWGISPAGFAGHSVGSYAAACLAGVFSLEDALKLVTARGRFMQAMPAGAMLSIALPAEAAAVYTGPDCSLAAVNSVGRSVLSGTFESIEALQQKLDAKGIKWQRLHTSHAFHSPMMEPAVGRFRQLARTVRFQAPVQPLISNLSGGWMSAAEATNPDTWAEKIRQPVQFAAGLDTLFKLKHVLLVETGPGNSLISFARQHSRAAEASGTLPLVRHPQQQLSDLDFLAGQLAKIWLSGYTPDWEKLYGGRRQRLPLPGYPFTRTRFPVQGDPFKLLQQPGPSPASNRKSAAYVPVWKQVTLSGLQAREGGAKASGLHWLVFAPGDEIGTALVDALRGRGNRVTVVHAGPAWSSGGAAHFSLDPERAGDYQQLLGHLQAAGELPDRVLHAWQAGIGMAAAQAEPALEMGYFSLLYFSQAWESMADALPAGRDRLPVTLLSSGVEEITGAEKINPYKALASGLARVIPQEISCIQMRCMDVEWPSGSAFQFKCLIRDVVDALLESSHKPLLAFRQRQRWVQEFERLEAWGGNSEQGLPADEDHPKAEGPEQPDVHPSGDFGGFKQGGTYLITGGTGRIGSLMTAYLENRYAARIIVTSSSKGFVIGDVEGTPASDNPVLIRADVADPVAMEKVIRFAKSNFGGLDGVIHAAGLTSGPSHQSPVREMSRELSGAQFQAKLKGTEVLQAVLRDAEPDFCLLMSSLAAVLGGLGFSAYASGNRFLDAFAAALSRESSFPWISVNWDSWEETDAGQEGFQAAYGQEAALSKAEGLAALELAIREGRKQVLVSATELGPRFRKWVQLESLEGDTPDPGAQDSLTETDRKLLSSSFLAPETSLQVQLCTLLSDFMGFHPIGVRDDFFELGGDSLKAMTFLARVQQNTGIRVPLQDFLVKPTVEGIEKQVSEGHAPKAGLIPKAKEKAWYPLSPTQKRIFISQQLDPAQTAYNLPQAIQITEEPDVEKMNRALNALISRHESLRTGFDLVDGVARQRIDAAASLRVEAFICEAETPDEQIRAFIRPFDLSRTPLVRAGLFKTGSGTCYFVLDMHHIISDGVSLGILLREFVALYSGQHLSPPALQYRDFSEWQLSEAGLALQEESARFWLDQFQDKLPQTSLPLDFRRTESGNSIAAAEVLLLDPESTLTLKSLAREAEVSLFVLLLALYKVLMGRFCNSEDVVTGVPAAGRQQPGLEGLIGFFLNTLPVRAAASPELPFRTFLQRVNTSLLAAMDHQNYPFDSLVEALKIKREPGKHPLFDTLVVMQGNDLEALDFPELGFRAYDFQPPVILNDLIVDIHETRGALNMLFRFDATLFRKDTIEKLCALFKTIVLQAIADPDLPLARLGASGSAQQAKVVTDFNDDLEDEF